MFKGYYTAVSGMTTQQRRQEALSNNVANATTPGYKADEGTIRSFPEMLIQQTGRKHIPGTNLSIPKEANVGTLNSGVYMQETIPNFTQGSIQETGISTDVALIDGNYPDENGSVFFTVQSEDGVRYTRNGNFTVDGQGNLVTHLGQAVLDEENNPIQTGGLDYTLTKDGQLQLENGETVLLGVSYVADVNQLVKEGSDLLVLDEAGDGQAVDARGEAGVTFSTQQGVLEGSTVDMGQTMTEMNSAYRLFELNQKVLQAYDQNMQKTVNDIAKL
ncbi:flagellar basal body rod protein subunit C [Pontibacillus halophilus JSM 076056 = DSM 19796]|uniref:Flagellar basal body rod protein subunit C n=1 Tax=Pontibacillus halophilus JSM 076056 = DSM 19796 TaxID=1385510 RepID=A0A0A5IDI2_9BACI|nr:flagellar hook-basal body protein [Pontibacillus halophilus]KGX93902.1 flagellar basal body rod protein subunit C [Pontibacillus halophilus JSM 076056 = DSM 19796]